MPLHIVRNDITKMQVDAIVSVDNEDPVVGPGNAFVTPGFDLPADYIIHMVSPLYIDGKSGEEKLLRTCYRKSLNLATKQEIRSIAFPMISTGSFDYPKEEGLRIAVEEIRDFLNFHSMIVYVVVFDQEMTGFGEKLQPNLAAYIDQNYVEEKFARKQCPAEKWQRKGKLRKSVLYVAEEDGYAAPKRKAPTFDDYTDENFPKDLDEILAHTTENLATSFSKKLLWLIQEKGMTNADVYHRALVSKKLFSKIKNQEDYHPAKLTVMQLCVGARLSMEESNDLMARAGYAFSPCDKTDLVFRFFLERKIYDMLELDIALEELGLPCIIS